MALPQVRMMNGLIFLPNLHIPSPGIFCRVSQKILEVEKMRMESSAAELRQNLGQWVEKVMYEIGHTQKAVP